MHPNEAGGVGCRLREAGDRDGRGVGGENRIARHLRADGGVEGALDLLALGRCLDHNGGIGKGDIVADRLDPFQRSYGILGSGFALLDGGTQSPDDARLALLGQREIAIGEQHAVAGLRRHLRDARTHLPRADHAHRFHARLLCSARLRLAGRAGKGQAFQGAEGVGRASASSRAKLSCGSVHSAIVVQPPAASNSLALLGPYLWLFSV